MAIKDRTTLKNYFITGAQPTQAQFGDLLDSTFLKGDTVPVNNITYGINNLTYNTTTTWDFNNGGNALVTLTGNTVLSIANMQAGQFGLLVVKQDATGGRTITLPASSRVVNGGGGAVALSTAANTIDVLSVFYDGTNYYWLCNLTFS